jgi:hypothetical protein
MSLKIVDFMGKSLRVDEDRGGFFARDIFNAMGRSNPAALRKLMGEPTDDNAYFYKKPKFDGRRWGLFITREGIIRFIQKTRSHNKEAGGDREAYTELAALINFKDAPHNRVIPR